MANASYVSVGKPLVGGAIYRAPLGTALPTDATSTLNAAFVSLGYISEDGVTNANSFSSKDIKDWGKSTVMTALEEKTDTFKFTLLESLNVDVLKMIFGDTNVTGSLANGLTIKANATEPTASSYVIELLLNGGYVKRIVIPNAKLSEIGELTYKSDEAIGYEATITALLDSNDNSHYEYIAKQAALFTITVTSVAGSTTGKTALTATPTLTSGNSYKYKLGTSVESVTYEQVLSTWTAWDGSADITATTNQIITLAEVDSDNKAKGVGSATVVAKA